MVNVSYLVLAMMLTYTGGGHTIRSYEVARSRLDAVFASDRFSLPFKACCSWATEKLREAAQLVYGFQSAGSCRSNAGSASTTRAISRVSLRTSPSSSTWPATPFPSSGWRSECANRTAISIASASSSAVIATEISARNSRDTDAMLLRNPSLGRCG